MKKIIIVVITSLALPVSFANADGIKSPLGMRQAEWMATSTYQNFQCPAGTVKSEGVDMNFTSDNNDDYWFANCVIFPTSSAVPKPILTPISENPNQIETSTVKTVAAQPVVTQTPILTPAPTVTNTSTTNTTLSVTTVDTSTPTAVIKTSILDEDLDLTWDWDKILEWIIAWFEKIWIKL